MNFLHFTVHAGPDKIIQVKFNQRANVRLMDDLNYAKYKLKKRYTYSGGLYNPPRVDLRPPSDGFWHLVVDLEGLQGEVRASVDVLT